MPTKNQKNQKETKFPENQVMMMLESMNDGIEILAEGQQQLIQNQNGLRDDLENFKIETRENFKKHDKKFKQIDKNFAKVFNSLDEIKQEVRSIRKELDQMKKQSLVKREEFEILVKRVEAVEMSMER